MVSGLHLCVPFAGRRIGLAACGRMAGRSPAVSAADGSGVPVVFDARPTLRVYPIRQTASMDITKLEAARRQLETALSLYLQEGDPVSIHTLAAAAHEVLTQISRKSESGVPMLYDFVRSHVKEEHRKDFTNTVHKAQNFFKHADRDHNEVLKDYNPGQAEVLLIDSCFAYKRIAKEMPPLLALFYVWARATFAHDWLKYRPRRLRHHSNKSRTDCAVPINESANLLCRDVPGCTHFDVWRLEVIRKTRLSTHWEPVYSRLSMRTGPEPAGSCTSIDKLHLRNGPAGSGAEMKRRRAPCRPLLRPNLTSTRRLAPFLPSPAIGDRAHSRRTTALPTRCSPV